MTRINFEVSDEQNSAIDSLLMRIGLKTRVQLFNTAFTLLEWTIRERESGRTIVSMDERTGFYKELVMPGLIQIPVKQVPIHKKPPVGEYLEGLSLLVNTDAQAKELADVANSFNEPLPPRLSAMLKASKKPVSAAAVRATEVLEQTKR